MNSQNENILKSGNEDRVSISLSRYEQMRESINQYELENDKLKKENAAMIDFIKKLGIPTNIKIIPASISSKTVRNSMDSLIEYHIMFLIKPDDIYTLRSDK